MIKLYKGDCLIESDHIEDSSVDLILTDLPYGTMKGRDYSTQPNQKQGSKTKNDHSWDNVIDAKKIYEIANRVLRKNGKMLLFAQQPFTTYLIHNAIPNIPHSYNLIWEKFNFANCLLINKACANFYEDILVFSKTHETNAGHPLRGYFNQELVKSKLDNKEINKILGNKMGSRYFGKGTQFCIPTEKNYIKLQKSGFFTKEYHEIKEVDNEFKKKYASVFNLPEGQKYKSNIFKYKRTEVGYHPTQKPVELLEDLIKTYSNPGNLVVDLTMGSGSTGVAAKNTGRDFTGIEMDSDYFQIADDRINNTLF